jgi:multiple sugar transport system substrate-binding protein
MYSWDGGETVTLNVDNDDVIEFADYWQDLIDRDLVSTDPPLTDAWYQGLASGKFASWIGAAWAPVFMKSAAANTAGLWSATDMPQWDASDPVYPTAGGSATSVLVASEHPIVAAEFAKWLNASPQGTELLTNQLSLFPAATAILEDETWKTQPDEFFGGQAVNEVFSGAASSMQSVVGVPFSTYFATSHSDTVIAAIANHTNLADAYHEWQKQLVAYAEDQGFTVVQG